MPVKKNLGICEIQKPSWENQSVIVFFQGLLFLLLILLAVFVDRISEQTQY